MFDVPYSGRHNAWVLYQFLRMTPARIEEDVISRRFSLSSQSWVQPKRTDVGPCHRGRLASRSPKRLQTNAALHFEGLSSSLPKENDDHDKF
jgi:hypothetical protein